MFLSAHFTLSELTKSQSAERHGIDNTPGEAEVANLKALCEKILEPVRAEFGVPIVPNSGYRSPELNAQIGGSTKSQHMQGEAVDFEIGGVSNYALASWIAENLEFDQLILECYTPGVPNSGWVHCSYSSSNNRNEALTYNKADGYRDGLIA